MITQYSIDGILDACVFLNSFIYIALPELLVEAKFLRSHEKKKSCVLLVFLVFPSRLAFPSHSFLLILSFSFFLSFPWTQNVRTVWLVDPSQGPSPPSQGPSPTSSSSSSNPASSPLNNPSVGFALTYFLFYFLVSRDSGVSLKGRISRLPEQTCWLYGLITLQRHSPLPMSFYSSEKWLSSRCLTSVIPRELVFPSWHQQLH